MNLAPHHLKAILAGMEAANPAREKRRFRRFAVSANISFARLSEGAPQQWTSALSRDVSEAGLGFVTSLKLQPGERIAVKLPADGKQVTIACRVVHTRPVADGIYAVGLEFAEILQAAASAEVAPGNPARTGAVSMARPGIRA